MKVSLVVLLSFVHEIFHSERKAEFNNHYTQCQENKRKQLRLIFDIMSGKNMKKKKSALQETTSFNRIANTIYKTSKSKPII